MLSCCRSHLQSTTRKLFVLPNASSSISVQKKSAYSPSSSVLAASAFRCMNTSSDSNNDDNINTNNNMVAISKTLALGAGCYWGTEKYVVKDFQKLFPNSIAKAEVGFMSPDPNAPVNPSYRAVCSGTTTHVEVLQVELNEPSKHLEELIKFFFMFHDPTTKNRQGNDVGTQYASAIFCSDSAQKETVQRVKEELQKLVDAGKVKYSGKKIETDVFDMHPFYAAHEEHQAYLEKNPGGYCNHYMRFKEWPTAASMN